MSRKFYTIQIIPENTTGSKKYRISSKQFYLFHIGLVLVAIILILFIVHIARINKTLISYEKMRVYNAQLVKQNANYEELFSRLDSLWIMENRIQNIFETFLENDSNKINSIIERNRFAHVPSSKNSIDFEGIHNWLTTDEKIRLERIPNVIPAVGIISKKFSYENKHLGIDISARKGNPVFASGSGKVTFAGNSGDLGNTVVIDHQNGYKTVYANLDDNITIKEDDEVAEGDVIGLIGDTALGDATGLPHLHFEIRNSSGPTDFNWRFEGMLTYADDA